MLQQAALPPKTNMLQYFSECVQGYSQNVCEQMPLPASDPISSNNCLFQGVVCACVHLCACIHVCISAINLYLFNSWAKLVSKYLKHHLRTSHWPCGLCNSNQAPPSPTPPHSGPVTQFCYSLCWPPILLQKQQQQSLSEPRQSLILVTKYMISHQFHLHGQNAPSALVLFVLCV